MNQETDSTMDLNLLFAREGYSTTEADIIARIIQLVYSDYTRDLRSRAEMVGYCFHASANFKTIANIGDQYSFIVADIEFLRLVSYLANIAVLHILSRKKVTQSNHLKLIQRLIFHAGVRQGVFFPCEKLKPTGHLHRIDAFGGEEIFAANLAFVLAHEKEHIKYVFKSEAEKDAENENAIQNANEAYSMVLELELDPFQLLKHLDYDKRIMGTSGSGIPAIDWIEEFRCDISALRTAVILSRKLKVSNRDLILSIIGTQIAQLLLDVSVFFLRVYRQSEDLSHGDSQKIVSLAARTVIFCGLVTNIIQYHMPEKMYKQVAMQVQAIIESYFSFASILIGDLSRSIKQLSKSRLLDRKSIRKVVEEWGYSHRKKNKIIVPPPGFSFRFT